MKKYPFKCIKQVLLFYQSLSISINFMKASKLSLLNCIIFLLISLLEAQLQNYREPIIDCSRAVLPYSIQTGRPYYTIPFRIINNSSSIYGIVTSLSSFQQSTRISIKVIGQNSTGFIIQVTSNIRSLSYIVVELSSFFNVGLVTSIYLPPVVKYDADLLLSELPIRGYNQWLQKSGKVQPFISEISYISRNLSLTYTLSIQWIWRENILKIRRSRLITKVTVSFLIYSKIGRIYLNVTPPSALVRFTLKNKEIPIFVGIRNLSFQINSNQSYYLLWTNSLRAEIQNVEFSPFIVMESNSTCYTDNSYLNGIDNPLDMMSCQRNCFGFLAFVKNFKVCLNFQVNEASLNWYPNGTTSIYQISDEITCQRFIVGPQSLICEICKNNRHFIDWQNGSCICEQGYYINKEAFKNNSECLRCSQAYCIFALETMHRLNYLKQNSTEQIQVQVIINKRNSVIPEKGTGYQSLQFSFFVNNQTIEPLIRWSSQKTFRVTLQNFPLSNTYNISIKIQSSILLVNEGLYLYLSPKQTYEFQIKKEKDSIRETMETVNNMTHTIAYISVIFASKVNIFSFIHLNSMLYLTSMIKWKNYGSLSRLKMTRDLFKLQPTNIFSSFNLRLPISPQFHSSYRAQISGYGQRTQLSIMYMCLAPQYILSLLIQIVVIELLLKSTKLLLIITGGSKQFEQKEQSRFSRDDEGNLVWLKQSYLTEIIESENKSKWQRVKKIWDNISSKRFIFYTNLFNSQLTFHAYLIFLQFKFSPSSDTQIVNLFVTISILGLIICGICLGPHSAYSKYKALCIIYKRSKYTQTQLSFYYYLNLTEILVFGASISLVSNSLYQLIAPVFMNLWKLVAMRKVLKRIEMVKLGLIISFLSLLGMGDYLGGQKLYIELVSIICMLLISSIQVLKIVKSIFVNSLGILKSTPSAAGKQIILKIKQNLKRD